MSPSVEQFVTGEAVALDLRTAAVPSRAVASLIDLLAQTGLAIGLGLLAANGLSGLSVAGQQAVTVVGLVVVLIGYPVGCETFLRGRTPGKAAMGLRVVRDDGGPIGFRQALVRGLFAAFLEKPGATLGVLPVVCSLLNRTDKRLGDLFAGTVVMRERVADLGGTVAQMPPQLAYWAANLELSRVSDDLAMSVRQFIARSSELTDAARNDLGGALVRAVLQVVAPQPPPGTPGWAVLAAVLAERHRRDEQRSTAQPADHLVGPPITGRPQPPPAQPPQPPDFAAPS